MNFKKGIVKFFSFISILLTFFILFVKFFSFNYYVASITKNFEYLDNNLFFSEADKKMIIDSSSSLNGIINISLILLGILIVIMLILNMFNTKDKLIKSSFIFVLPYILISLYSILDLINIFMIRDLTRIDFFGFFIYFFLGILPLIIISLPNKKSSIF
ncbi:hypothetical protein ACSW8Q_18235 (plasmid) [Clostridium perfringens]|uniref:hypothetical protein n=1 Tax=Clostridium perfringens TaxID=1502 RepID=UPI002446E6D6|nr:hypothetical protein [Clostridium perfringens]MDH2472922.1 hypothetical protein [Clostridium perfringens]WVM62384.1 hypothetical protein V1657_16605 [Clostridium perfringens]